MGRLADQAYLRTRLAIMTSKLFTPRDVQTLAKLPLDELGAASGFDAIPGDTHAARLAAYERSLMQTWLD